MFYELGYTETAEGKADTCPAFMKKEDVVKRGRALATADIPPHRPLSPQNSPSPPCPEGQAQAFADHLPAVLHFFFLVLPKCIQLLTSATLLPPAR